MEKNNKQEAHRSLYVGMIINKETFEYSVHLVNNSAINYTRVKSLTGAFCSFDEDLLETSKAVRDKGPLPAGAILLVEQSDLDGLDFVIWYDLDLVPEKGATGKLSFSLSKYLGLRDSAQTLLPGLDRMGWMIELTERDGELIDEMVKTLVMESQLHKHSE